MGKLITHIIIAALIYFGLSALDAHWIIIGIGIALGVMGVHVIWERFFNPYHYLGIMSVAPDDPLMESAKREALESMERFLAEIYPNHQKDTMVKFKYDNAAGEIEYLWGDLISTKGPECSVYVRTRPIQPKPDFSADMSVNTDQLVDWSVELPDGGLLGGYTNRALFRIFEREEGYMHPRFREHMERFRDAEDVL